MVNQQFNISDVDDKLVMLLLYCIENNINLFKYCGISSEKELIVTDELEIIVDRSKPLKIERGVDLCTRNTGVA